MHESASSFVWYELSTNDLDTALDFYRGVLGWSARDSGQEGMRYVLLSASGRDVAGAMQMDGAQAPPPVWIGYVSVPDVDAAASAVVQAGGMIHRAPADIPGVGRFAMVADPDGAPLALLAGPSDQTSEAFAPGTHGHGGWHELYTTDLNAAFDYYSDLFGWTKSEDMDMGEMGTYRTFATADTVIGGMMQNPEGDPISMWLYYFSVDDIDEAIRLILEHGGTVYMGPSEVPGGGWIAHASDPQGAMFAVLGPRGT